MWRADINNWQKITIQTATFYLDLAEKRLDESVETSKNITDKNDKLLALCITLITSILSYVTITSWKLVGIDYFITTLTVMCFFLFAQLFFLIKNMIPFRIGTKGEEPRFVLNSNFIIDYDKDEQYVNLALHVCEVYQKKINCNQRINNKRNNRLLIAIYLMLGLPISFLAVSVYFLF